MPTKDRIHCFDFIEFPAKSIEDLKQAKVFYMNVFGWSYKDWGDDYSPMDKCAWFSPYGRACGDAMARTPQKINRSFINPQTSIKHPS
jgi:predicted enzyme related to lactoylglutathione lyase